MDEVSNQTVPDLLFKLLASNLSHFYPTCHTLHWSLPSRRVGETQEPPSSLQFSFGLYMFLVKQKALPQKLAFFNL